MDNKNTDLEMPEWFQKIQKRRKELEEEEKTKD